MTFEQLSRFLTVAKYKSFTKAANSLFITTPTLSRCIAELENELGTSLFNRRSEGASLTAQGEMLYQDADRILEELTHITEKLRACGSERIMRFSISIDQTFPMVLCALMERFRRGHPSVQYEILPMRLGYTLWDILEWKYDFGVTLMQEMLDFRNRESLCCLPLRTDPHLVINMSVRHPLADKKALSVQDIEGYPVLFVCENGANALQTQIIRKRMATWFDESRISLCESQEHMLLRTHMEQAVFPSSSNTIGFYGRQIVSIPLTDDAGELIRQPGDDYALVWNRCNPNPGVQAFAEQCMLYFEQLDQGKMP